jgi:branched-chain amino acid aminotransferase
MADDSVPRTLDHTRLRYASTTIQRPVGWLNDPPTGLQSEGTDHMLMVRWNISKGWADPEIVPYGPLPIWPTASCINYATQCFEGMKVYRGHDDKLRLFRPEKNCRRLNKSAVQVSLPTFDTLELGRLIEALLALDCPRWLPPGTCRGKALYVRPAMIADGPQIGVKLPEDVLLFVIAVPWPEIPTSLVENGLELITSRTDTVRAWPGGFGSSKIGANYGPTFITLGEARAQGFDQVLWLLGEEAAITEGGASNFFAVWKNATGGIELITAPLEEKVILPGVTRDSVLALARERLSDGRHTSSHPPVHAIERRFFMSELESAFEEGRLIEMFVTGTAVSDIYNVPA